MRFMLMSGQGYYVQIHCDLDRWSPPAHPPSCQPYCSLACLHSKTPANQLTHSLTHPHPPTHSLWLLFHAPKRPLFLLASLAIYFLNHFFKNMAKTCQKNKNAYINTLNTFLRPHSRKFRFWISHCHRLQKAKSSALWYLKNFSRDNNTDTRNTKVPK